MRYRPPPNEIYINKCTTFLKRAFRQDKRNKFSPIKIVPVKNIDDFLNAMRHLHDVYLNKGLIISQPGGLLFAPQFLSSSNKLFIAKIDNDIIGTISLFTQGKEKIPAQKLFSDVIDENNSKSCEIGSLSINHAWRNTPVLPQLYITVMLYAIFHLGMQNIFIQIDPRKMKFYQKLFLFTQVGTCRYHPDYKNTPTILMNANTKYIWRALYQYRQITNEQTTIKNIFASTGIDSCLKNIKHYAFENKTPIWTAENIYRYCRLCKPDHKKLLTLPEEALNQFITSGYYEKFHIEE